MNRAEVFGVLNHMTECWPQRPISPQTMEAYAESLVDLPVEALQSAVERLKTECEWFPSIAALRKEAVAVTPGNGVPDAAMAFKEVRNQISRRGWTATLPGAKPLEWTHPAIADAVDTIGWMNICTSENEEALRAHFIKLYGVSAHRIQREQLTTPLGKQLEAGLAQIGKRLELDS